MEPYMESSQHSTTTMPPRRVPDHADSAGNGASDASTNGHDEMDLTIPKARPGWVVFAGILAVALLAALLITGLIPRHRDNKELTTEAADAQNAPVLINAFPPRRGAATIEISLPGT